MSGTGMKLSSTIQSNITSRRLRRIAVRVAWLLHANTCIRRTAHHVLLTNGHSVNAPVYRDDQTRHLDNLFRGSRMESDGCQPNAGDLFGLPAWAIAELHCLQSASKTGSRKG